MKIALFILALIFLAASLCYAEECGWWARHTEQLEGEKLPFGEAREKIKTAELIALLYATISVTSFTLWGLL